MAFKDLTGKRVGKLTVISFYGWKIISSKRKASIWTCLCDCGNTTQVVGGNLTQNHTKSCGCSRKEANKRNGKTRQLAYGEAAFNSLFSTYISAANKRKLAFSISKEMFRNLTKQPCHYCGQEPNQIKKVGSNNGDYIYNGIDRLDSKQGYIKTNVVPCCGTCNKAKYTMTESQFLDWIKRLVKYQNEKWSDRFQC